MANNGGYDNMDIWSKIIKVGIAATGTSLVAAGTASSYKNLRLKSGFRKSTRNLQNSKGIHFGMQAR